MSFDDVCISELDDIENKLGVNVHIFGCNKDFESQKIIRKSQNTFDKKLDLLLIDEINHYILIKDINKFMLDNSHVQKTCQNCLNTFYSIHKYEDHEYYCKNRSSKKLIAPYKRYLKFENSKNCYLNDFIITSDFDCVIDKNTNQHRCISGGYYIKCRNEKYSKMVQNFM